MLRIEIQNNWRSISSIKTMLLSILIWPLVQMLQVYFNYDYLSNGHISKILGIPQKDVSLFLITAFFSYFIFERNMEVAWRIGFEKYQGTISQLFITPFSKAKWIINKSIASIFSGSWLYAVIIVVFTWSRNSGLIAMYLFLLYGTSILWSSVLTCLYLAVRDGSRLFSLVDSFLYLVSGIQAPFRLIPNIFKYTVSIFPLGILIEILKISILVRMHDVFKWIIILIFINLVYLILLFPLIKFIENCKNKLATENRLVLSSIKMLSKAGAELRQQRWQSVRLGCHN